MGAGKWIGGIIGFMAGGPLGALAGYALGSLIELGGNTASYTTDYGNGQTEEDVFAGQRNSFLFSMLVMASYIKRAAEEKLQDINNAKEIIYKARGIK